MRLAVGDGEELSKEGCPYPVHVSGNASSPSSLNKIKIYSQCCVTSSSRHVLIQHARATVNLAHITSNTKSHETGNCVLAYRDNATTQDPTPA